MVESLPRAPSPVREIPPLLLVLCVLVCEPLVEIRLRLHRQVALHTRMPEAAQLRARNFVLSRLGRLKPHFDHASRHCVLLQTQVRNEKAVDNVLRSQIYSHHFADRHMHFVFDGETTLAAEFSVRSGISDLPVELIGIDPVEHLPWRSMLLYIGPGCATHKRQDDKDDRSRSGPDYFEARVTLDIFRLAPRPGP